MLSILSGPNFVVWEWVKLHLFCRLQMLSIWSCPKFVCGKELIYELLRQSISQSTIPTSKLCMVAYSRINVFFLLCLLSLYHDVGGSGNIPLHILQSLTFYIYTRDKEQTKKKTFLCDRKSEEKKTSGKKKKKLESEEKRRKIEW